MKALLVLPLVGVLGLMQGDPSDVQLSPSASGKSPLDLLGPRDEPIVCQSIGKSIANVFTIPDEYKGALLAAALPGVFSAATAYGICLSVAVVRGNPRSMDEIRLLCRDIGISAAGGIGLAVWWYSASSMISVTPTATRFSTVTVTATQMPIKDGSYGIAINDQICADVQHAACRHPPKLSKWLGRHDNLTVLEHNDGSGRRSITIPNVNSPHGWIADHNVTTNPDNTGSARVVVVSPVGEYHFGPGLKVIYKFNKLRHPARVDLAAVEALVANIGLDWAERAMSDHGFGTYFGVADFGPDVNLSFAIVPEDGKFDDSYQDVDICGGGG